MYYLLKMSYYSVHIGRCPGIYNTWVDCKKEIDCLDYSEFKKFNNKADAEEFLKYGRKGREVSETSSKKSKPIVYYVVHKGKSPGIYNTWNECKSNVHGFKKPIFKKFENLEQAQKFLVDGKTEEEEGEDILDIDPNALKIYTDGSLIRRHGYIGCGYGLYVPKYNLKQGSILFENKTNNRAELLAAIDAISLATNKNETSLTIYTDSSYVIHIFGKTGEKYKAKGYKNVKNKDLVQRAVEIKHSIRVVFVHVKAHSGDITDHAVYGNDVADKIANTHAVSDYINQDHNWVNREYKIGKYKCSLPNIPMTYLKEYINRESYKTLCKTNEHYRTESHMLTNYISMRDVSSDITYR